MSPEDPGRNELRGTERGVSLPPDTIVSLQANALGQVAALERPGPFGRYRQLRFGVEFCAHRMPSARDVLSAMAEARRLNAGFTLVTPYLPASELAAVARLVELSARELDELEVAVNDWALVDVIRGLQVPIRMSLGRVLNRQRTSPEFWRAQAAAALPEGFRRYARRSAADNAHFVRWLKELGFSAAEHDNAIQGVEPEPGQGIRRGLHLPWVYVTTTRRCGYGNFGRQRDAVHAGRCKHQCEGYIHELRVRGYEVPLVLNGNTQFYRNDTLPAPCVFDIVIEHAGVPT